MTVVGTDKKAVVKYTDMNEQKQQTAVDCCAAVMERFSDTQDIAKYIKHEFDRRFGGVWQCVVGKFFGCYVTHQPENFIYFTLSGVAVLLFQAKPKE